MTAGEARFPVSSQQLLWCAPELAGAWGPRYIIYRSLRITGQLDVEALQAALDDVVARHESLRTIVARDAEPPYQEVRPPMAAPLVIHDLPGTAPESRQRLAEELLAEAEASNLDVEQLPLLRVNLTRFDPDDSVLSVVSHHSACDGWSMNILLRDIVARYAARTGERPPELPDLQQYQDYARWQLENFHQPDMVENRLYWKEQLDGAAIFTVPSDHPVPAVYTAPYLRYPFAIDNEVTAAVSRFAKAERCFDSMVMLAAFDVLAYRISGTLDLAVSTLFHGRGEPRFKDTIGVFMNFLTMRTDLAGCRSFRDIALRNRTVCLQAYEHEVPYQQVLQTVPSLVEPLADPANSFIVFGYWDRALTGATGEPYQIGESVSVIRKRSRVSETPPGGVGWIMGMSPSGEVGGGVHFSTEVFDEPTVAGWVSDYSGSWPRRWPTRIATGGSCERAEVPLTRCRDDPPPVRRLGPAVPPMNHTRSEDRYE